MDLITLHMVKRQIQRTSYKSPLDFGAEGDGITDDSQAIQECLSSGGVIVFPALTYKVTRTLWIPSNTVVFGYGAEIKLGDNYNLQSVIFREGSSGYNAYPIVCNEENAKNIHVEGLKVEGNKNELMTDRVLGLSFIDAEDCKMVNVEVNWINMKDDITVRERGYNIATARSKNIELINCKGSYGGYEVFGIYDSSENVNVIGGYSGVGWRTSFQIHRGCENINVVGLMIEQNHPEAHSCYTIHGSSDMNVSGVTNTGVVIRGITDATPSAAGGVQLVEGNEHNISFVNGSIKTNNRGFNLPGNNNVKILGNGIDAQTEAVVSRGTDVKQLIKDNTLLSSTTITKESDNVIIKDNI